MISALLIDTAAGLIVAAILGLFGFLVGRRAGYTAVYEAAAKTYVKELGRAIMNPRDQDIYIHARTIVAIRGDLRQTLTSLADLLNADIDRLSLELVSLEENRQDESVRTRVSDTIKILRGKWPVKVRQIEIQVRKLMTELGLQPKG